MYCIKSKRLPIDFTYLCTLKREVGHEPTVPHDDRDDGVLDGLGGETLAGPGVDHGDAAVDPSTPAVARDKFIQCALVHEEDDLGPLLRTQLQADRGGGDRVVVDRLATDLQGTLTVLAADHEAGLDHAREYQDAVGLAEQLLVTRTQVAEVLQDLLNVGVDFLPVGRDGTA